MRPAVWTLSLSFILDAIIKPLFVFGSMILNRRSPQSRPRVTHPVIVFGMTRTAKSGGAEI